MRLYRSVLFVARALCTPVSDTFVKRLINTGKYQTCVAFKD